MRLSGRTSVTQVSSDGAAKPRRRGRTVAIIAGVVVVVLGVTAGIVIPQIQRAQHAQRVEDYTALVEQLRDIYQSQAETETTLHAAAALAHTRHTEMLNAANAVEELGQAPEPMLPESHAQALEMVGASAATELGPVDESEAAVAVQQRLATAFVEARESQSDGEQLGELPELLADLTVEQAAALRDEPVEAKAVRVVADPDVTDEDIAAVQAEIAAAERELEQIQAALAEEIDYLDAVAEAGQIMLPVLQEAAAAVDDFLAEVEKQAAKAEAEVVATTAAAAERVRESATSTQVSKLHAVISAYVAAGEESFASHAAVVKAEKEAAEAKRKAEEEAARKRASQGSSSSEGWGSKGLCNYWAPMGGGMYMAPCP